MFEKALYNVYQGAIRGRVERGSETLVKMLSRSVRRIDRKRLIYYFMLG